MRTLIIPAALVLLCIGLLVPRMTPAASLDRDVSGPGTSYPVELNLQSDICHHDQYIWGASHLPPHNIKLTFAIVSGLITISGPAPWVTVASSQTNPTTPFDAAGSGIVAGFPDTLVAFHGTIIGDTISGTYSFGVEGAENPGGLPPCDDDNNPATFPDAHRAVYVVKPKPSPTPTRTAPPTPTFAFCIMGPGSCTPTPTPANTPAATPPTPPPTATPHPNVGTVPSDCETDLSVSDNGSITGKANDVLLECVVGYDNEDLATGRPSAQTQFDADTSELLRSLNLPILGEDIDGITIELGGCTPVKFNFSLPRATRTLEMGCRAIIRAFGAGGSGLAAGAAPGAVLETQDLVQLTTNASFPPYGAQWASGPVHVAIVDTTAPDTVIGYVTDLGVKLSPFGDVNCNFVANSIDAALLLQLVAGRLASQRCQIAGDVDRNFHINAIDAALILQYVAGMIPHLPT